MIESIVFYSLIGLVVICFAGNIDKKRNVKFSLCMIVILLSLVSGLRHQTVGIDTNGYIDLISKLRGGYLPRLSNITEQGFIFLSYILVNLSDSYVLALLVYAFITNTLVLLRLYDYRCKISYAWAVFVYYMLFYFTSFNTIRQWLAMAIVFYGTRYIGDNAKSNIKYLIFVFLGVLMHKTAIFAILFLPLFYFTLPSKIFKVQLKKFAMVIVILGGVIYVYRNMVESYSNYISSYHFGDISWITIMIALFFAGIILYDNDGKIVIRDITGKVECDHKTGIRYETLMFFVGIAIALMVYFYRYADRISQYFLLYEIVVFSYYIKNKKTQAFTTIFVFSVCMFLRFSSYLSSGYGEIPYITFWM